MTIDTTRSARPTQSCRALSVRRPWANLIVAGYKTVENRTWSTSYRGDLLIHAGKNWDHDGPISALAQGIVGFASPGRCPGGYLGVVRLVDVHPAAGCCAPWGHQGPGVFHWVLTDAVELAAPVPGPGRLGLYRPPAGIMVVR
ncbi:hypothetical protein B7C42_07655 [Nocardia cerradoensis]|uniref:ASCH domain-containing protein n=1 Tax=Nocardia cerradoensis TaxID=85688 RepID=A0A231GUC6_9NOCA|nr:ASCH domain-containing protein [Nocardia cerradoensis]OXR40230.1 hypothetical protein B7C42_07655 [Nocardia cerradoensis]